MTPRSNVSARFGLELQEKSYFSLKLPQGWWIFGLDQGLAEDIDIFQFKYFSTIADEQVRLTLCDIRASCFHFTAFECEGRHEQGRFWAVSVPLPRSGETGSVRDAAT